MELHIDFYKRFSYLKMFAIKISKLFVIVSLDLSLCCYCNSVCRFALDYLVDPMDMCVLYYLDSAGIISSLGHIL